MPGQGNADEAGGLATATDGVEVLAKAGVVQEQEACRERRPHQHHGERQDAEEAGIAQGQEPLLSSRHRDRPALVEPQGRAPGHQHRGQRDDERGIGVRAAQTPLTTPQRAAAARPADTAIPGPVRGSSQTVIVPINATTAPTERSIPPIRITSVMPRARIALIEICWARSSRFSASRNCGTQTRKTPRSTTMATT